MATPNRWLQHDIRRPKPPVVEPVGSSVVARAPKDAIILFDGTTLDAWRTPEGGPAKWKVNDGFMEIAPDTGPIETKAKFGDVQLHVEWASPSPPGGKGQDRGNSGIFLMGLYELQVLDSYQADTYADGQAGALYGQYPPLPMPLALRESGKHTTSLFAAPGSIRKGSCSSPLASRSSTMEFSFKIMRSCGVEPTGWRRNPTRPAPIAVGSSFRTMVIRCASATSGSVNYRSAPPPSPKTSPGPRSSPYRRKPWTNSRGNTRWDKRKTRSQPRLRAATDICSSRWLRARGRSSCSRFRRPSLYCLTPMLISRSNVTIRAASRACCSGSAMESSC